MTTDDGDVVTEAQGYGSIGQLSSDAERVDLQQKGWQGATAEGMADQITGFDTSFWNRRANTQAQATSDGDLNYAEDFFAPDNTGDILANHLELPYPAGTPASFPQAAAGTIDGATSAAERSANGVTQI